MTFLDKSNRGSSFKVLLGLTLLTIIGMQLTGAPLKTSVAPGGIVSFELVGTFAKSQAIIQSWQGNTMAWAGINMGMDFLFIVLYASVIALGCILVAEKLLTFLPTLSRMGGWMVAGVWVAAFLDIIENIALIQLLTGSLNESLPSLARWCAIPKFGLILIALLYLLVAVIILSYQKLSHNPD